MPKYFEYHLEKAPRIQYGAYFTGCAFALMPVVASCFFGKHLFGFPFSWQTIDGYAFVGLIIFLLVSMLTHSDADEVQNFRFGKDGFYWDNGALIGKQSFYRPAEKIRHISLNQSGRLELIDNLGETFWADNLVYSELLKKQFAECFPTAWVQDIPPIQAKNKAAK